MLGVAQLMLILDVTVVAIALPHMGADLDLSRDQLTWVVSSYTLAFGGLLLLGGRAADLLGARRLIFAGLLLFVLASLVAGFAVSAPMLLAGRVAQGIAAAMLSPAALSVVVTTFDGEERNRALGIWSALGGGGAALGVLLGGLLTSGPGWPWVFIVNVPIGILLIVGLRTRLPRHTPTSMAGKLDVLGAVLVTAATASLTYALIRAGDLGWTSPIVLGTAAAAILLYVAFTARQLTAKNPLMQIRLLTRRPVATGTLLITVATALMVMVFFAGTFYLQNHLGLSALVTGLLFLPVALATIGGAQLAGRLLSRTGARMLGGVGLFVAAGGMALPAIVGGPVAVVVGIAIAASGTGVAFVVASATALGQVAPHEAGLASGIVSTFHEFGASLGAALMSGMAAASIIGGGTEGFTRGFAAAAIVAATVGVVVFVMSPGRMAPPVTAPAGADAA